MLYYLERHQRVDGAWFSTGIGIDRAGGITKGVTCLRMQSMKLLFAAKV